MRRASAPPAEALVLMAKAPIPGRVKTRLCPPLSPREAAGLYACLLEDAASEMAGLRGVARYLAYAPPEAGGHFGAGSFRGYALHPQSGEDLGERMTRAAAAAFDRGARRVVVIGADCPALPASRVREAFRELSEGAGAVFGPADDGGFYLVGLSSPAPLPFEGIAWSTGTVLGEVTRRCRVAGIAYSLLAAERDVDVAEDVAALRLWARSRSRPSCPRTRRWISASVHKYGNAPRASMRRSGKARD